MVVAGAPPKEWNLLESYVIILYIIYIQLPSSITVDIPTTSPFLLDNRLGARKKTHGPNILYDIISLYYSAWAPAPSLGGMRVSPLASNKIEWQRKCII
jgi:hypothetical protein